MTKKSNNRIKETSDLYFVIYYELYVSVFNWKEVLSVKHQHQQFIYLTNQNESKWATVNTHEKFENTKTKLMQGMQNMSCISFINGFDHLSSSAL